MVDTACVSDILADYKATLKDCEEVTLQTIKNEKFLTKIIGVVFKMFAPML